MCQVGSSASVVTKLRKITETFGSMVYCGTAYSNFLGRMGGRVAQLATDLMDRGLKQVKSTDFSLF